MKKNTWKRKSVSFVGAFLLISSIVLFSSVPALASSGPETIIHPKPFATRLAHRKGQQQAIAVTCSGNGCTGLDPYASGCAASFYPAASRESGGILVELEYSTICGTNWTQAYWLDGSTPAGWGASIERFSGPNGPHWYQVYWTLTRQWWINSNQVYSPMNKAEACFMYAPVYGISICTNKV